MRSALDVALSNKYVIDVSKPWHVAWWAARLGISEQQVVDLVKRVGDNAENVRNHLRRDGHAVDTARSEATVK